MAGVYIHIPYCESKCFYCDFYSSGKKKAVPDEYVNALLRDIKNAKLNFRPQTVYFGGGTPSLLNAKQVFALLDALKPQDNAEITLEANPGTVDFKKLCDFKNAGINRLSVGVQSANDDSLKRLGRAHNARQSAEILADAQKAGFANISADMMLGLPNYTFEELKSTIELIKNSTHISAYILKIEPNTVFGKKPIDNLPNDDATAEFYLYCIEELKKQGFAQYEISNFAKENYKGKHNLLYWNCEDYYAFGPASHGCVNGKRFYTKKGTQKYIECSQPLIYDGVADYNDYIMLRLRLNDGLDFDELKTRYNTEFTKKQIEFCKALQKNDLAIITDKTIKLKPKGMLLQNSILTELL